eukprot:TRINITY_DN2456_c0_g1_i1.p1 TRINITY_DN2456_c0_g1~~TRINITY_DN2456_c0_g1_i1.p1  ORF type:complete len:307 (+),score=77.79 TRINITY_DN2456_c0_g1_i1:65-985(+)
MAMSYACSHSHFHFGIALSGIGGWRSNSFLGTHPLRRSGCARAWSAVSLAPQSLYTTSAMSIRSSSLTRGGSGEGEDEEKWWPSALKGRSPAEICRVVQHSYFELCLQNMGRPAAMALYDLVAAVVDAYVSGFSRDQLSLQLLYGEESSHAASEFSIDAAGYRLTASEEMYRRQWLDAIYSTMRQRHILKLRYEQNNSTDASAFYSEGQPAGSSEASSSSAVEEDPQREEAQAEEDPWLASIVYRVLLGMRTGEEQSSPKFDRALATMGASGGVAAEKAVISPQWVPVSQLVLLTIKVLKDREGQV